MPKAFLPSCLLKTQKTQKKHKITGHCANCVKCVKKQKNRIPLRGFFFILQRLRAPPRACGGAAKATV